MKIITINVNGIQTSEKKDLFNGLKKEDADQEDYQYTWWSIVG